MKLKALSPILILFLSISNVFSQNCDAWFYSTQDPLNHLQYSFFDGSFPEDDITSYSWDFGDGNSSSEKNPVHIYAEEGTFIVNLTISTGNCQDTYSEIVDVFINPACIADFMYYSDPQSLTVQFENLSVVPEISSANWLWEFGDGETSTEMNPTHTYSTDTSYTVNLTVVSNDCNIATTMIVYAGDDYYGDDCLSMFSYDPLDPAVKTFQFWDLSWQGNDSIINYSWDFGDGEISNEQNPIHTYSDVGEYEVTLSIETNTCSNISSNFVFAGDNGWYSGDCQALFWFVENQDNPYQIEFHDISHAEGNILDRMWQFGDGQISHLQNPVHVYSEEGTYDVILTIITEYCQSDFFMQITVGENSVYCSNCHALFYPVIDGGNVQFFDLTRGEPEWWYWDFGDGNTSSEQNPSYSYDELGVHRVAFSTGNGDCTNSLIMDIYLDQRKSSANISYAIPQSIVNVEETEKPNYKIFPNPARDYINISFPEKTNAHIKIYNSSGQLLMENNVEKAQVSKQINIEDFKSGLYFVKIQTETDCRLMKFVK